MTEPEKICISRKVGKSMLIFERTAPEETGVPSGCILRIIKRLQARQIPMHSLLLMHHDKLIFEGYYAPCTADRLHRMFSVSKSFTSIAVGLLIDEGRVALDDPVIQYFPDKLPDQVHPWIARMTIRDMLMMRSCHASTTYKLDMASDWVASFFATPPTHPPGTLFHYDTSAAHTLCALVERLTGRGMLDYLKQKLEILGLSGDSYMLKDPFGVSMGGSGLVARPLDLMRFAYLIAHRGNVLGRQLLSPGYIDLATSLLTETCATAPLPSEGQGYGLQFWRNEKNGFTCYGMGGQLIIFLPEYQLICVTTADTQSIQGGNQQIYDALYEELLPFIQPHGTALCDVDGRAQKLLVQTRADLAMTPLKTAPVPGSFRPFDNKVFQVVGAAPAFQRFCVHFEEDIGTLSFIYRDESHAIRFGLGSMATGSFPVYDLWYAASGAWLSDGTLFIKVHIIDAYVGSVQFQLSFQEDSMTLFMSKKEESLFQEFTGHLYCVPTSDPLSPPC